MPSKRELKKDIRALSEIVITDALEMSVTFEKEKEHQKILDIIVEMANLHNDLITRVNHPDGKDNPKLVKKYYNAIIKDLLAGCNKAYEKLNAIANPA